MARESLATVGIPSSAFLFLRGEGRAWVEPFSARSRTWALLVAPPQPRLLEQACGGSPGGHFPPCPLPLPRLGPCSPALLVERRRLPFSLPLFQLLVSCVVFASASPNGCGGSVTC